MPVGQRPGLRPSAPGVVQLEHWPDWEIEADPANRSEVEVTFTSQGPEQTRVELEHRHIDRHGPGWQAVHEGIEGEAGWPLYLNRYAALITKAG